MNIISKKAKIFKDPVHGYISIDEDIVDLIIDSNYFQRLRRIEQTSMRCVYPSARHDRFAHSLGTYYLAKTATGAVIRTVSELGIDGTLDNLKSLAFNFEIAALLHDIGHSPMSHTLEKFFMQSEDIFFMLKNSVGNTVFANELDSVSPNPHEVVSGIIAWDCFRDELSALCAQRSLAPDLEFVVRCITGAVYSDKSIPDVYCRNALIRLLNSEAIDVDKLDYIKRDSIVSGYDNIAVDTHRLLNSPTAVPLEGEKERAFALAFGKSALSVVQNVVDCRNMLFTWVYSHHKVVYESDYLLKQAVDGVVNDGNLREYFSVDAIKKHLCCDDDVWVLLKTQREMPAVIELMDRRKQRTALWKTKVEFDLLFPRKVGEGEGPVDAVDAFDVGQMIREIDIGRDGYEEFCRYIDNKYCAEGKSKVAVFIKPKAKITTIKPNDVYVAINNIRYQFTSFKTFADRRFDNVFVYVYIDRDALKEPYKNVFDNDKNAFIQGFVDYIKTYPNFFHHAQQALF